MDFATMKEAVIYGNVMGPFAVEDFGIKRLLSITKDDVRTATENIAIWCNSNLLFYAQLYPFDNKSRFPRLGNMTNGGIT